MKLKTQEGKDQEFSVQKLIAATKPTKLVYKILIRKNSTRPQKSQEKWVKDCGLEVVEDLSWRSIYLLPRLCTISTRIRNFQFKFLHRRIATNTFLFKVGISDTALSQKMASRKIYTGFSFVGNCIQQVVGSSWLRRQIYVLFNELTT